MTFVKSSITKSSVANSRSAIERILRRYGATGFSVGQKFNETGDPEGVTISFIVPDSPGSTARVPVSLPINIKHVYDALYGKPSKRVWENNQYVSAFDPNGYDKKKLPQAERVAWRNLVLWIDAALSAASVRLQTITEAFFAHTVIQLDNGSQVRMAEYIEQAQGQLPAGVRALLATPVEVET